MLLATIHGKRCAAADESEDLLTSTVFGHLRFVDDADFWSRLFGQAASTGESRISLRDGLRSAGVVLRTPMNLQIDFWPRFPGYGEPDLVLRFRSSTGRPVILVVEVKLHAPKSGVDERDQLLRYYNLLREAASFPGFEESPYIGLIYLTLRYAADEVRASVARTEDPIAASQSIFALQWQDVLEAASATKPGSGSLLDEVIRFLRVRGFERFKGFDSSLISSIGRLDGHFYQRRYFRQQPHREYFGNFYVQQ